MNINFELGMINSRLTIIRNSIALNVKENQTLLLTHNKDNLTARSANISSSLKNIDKFLKEKSQSSENFNTLNVSWTDFYKQLANELSESTDIAPNELMKKIQTVTTDLKIFQDEATEKTSEPAVPKDDTATKLPKTELDDDDDDKKIALLRNAHIQSLLIPEMKTKYKATFTAFPLLLITCKQLIDKILDGEFGALKGALLAKEGSVIAAEPFIKLLIIFYIRQENPKKDKDAPFIDELFQETSDKKSISTQLSLLRDNKADFPNELIEKQFLDTSGEIELPHVELFHNILPDSKFTNANNTSKKVYSDFQEAISSYYSPSVDLVLAAALQVEPSKPKLLQNLFNLIDKTKQKDAMELGLSVLRTDELDIRNIDDDQRDNLLFAIVPFVAQHDIKKAPAILQHIKHDLLRSTALCKVINFIKTQNLSNEIELVLEHISTDPIQPKRNAITLFEILSIDTSSKKTIQYAKTLISKNPEAFLLAFIKKFMKVLPTKQQIADLSEDLALQTIFTEFYAKHLISHGADPQTIQSFIEMDKKSSLFGEFLWTEYYSSKSILNQKGLDSLQFTPKVFEEILTYLERCTKNISHPLFKALLLKNVLSTFLYDCDNIEIDSVEDLYKATHSAREFNSNTVLTSSSSAAFSTFLANILSQIELLESPYIYAKTLNIVATFCLFQIHEAAGVQRRQDLESKLSELKELFHKKSKEVCEPVYLKKLINFAYLATLHNPSLACDMLKDLESHTEILDMALSKILVKLLEFSLWDKIKQLNEQLDTFSNQAIVEKYKNIISGLKITESYQFYIPAPNINADVDADPQSGDANSVIHSSSGSEDERVPQTATGERDAATWSSDSESRLGADGKNEISSLRSPSLMDISEEEDTMLPVEEKAKSRSTKNKRSLSSASEDEQTVPMAKRVKQIIPTSFDSHADQETSSDDEKDTRNS
jgi:hypothetical protein